MPVLSYTMHGYVLNWLKGSVMPTAPSNLKLALLTAAPDPAGTGMIEPNGGTGYTRQAITFGSITTGSGISSIKNTAPVVFGPVTGSDWAAVTYVGLVNGDDDVLLAYGPLAAQRVAPVDDTISFGVNTVQIRLK